MTVDNLPGLEALETADLAVFFIRYRFLPDDQLQKILAYCRSGKPRVGLRTTNHAFRYRVLPDDPKKKWDYGFGTEFFGQRFIGYQAGQTEVSLIEAQKGHAILRGVKPFRSPSWLYYADKEEYPIASDVVPLLMGHPVTAKPKTPPVPQLCAWFQVKDKPGGGKTRVFYTSLGHPQDFEIESMRKLLVNAVLWALGMDDQIPADGACALMPGPYEPLEVGLRKHKKGVFPPKVK
jgi:type 1 glutamine amidotransferase